MPRVVLTFWIVVSCVAALRLSLSGREFVNPTSHPDFPGWPTWLLPSDAVPLHDAPFAEFATDLDSRVGLFVAGASTWLVRWLPVAERGAHPAEDCFVGNGFSLTAPKLVRDAAGVEWREFVATREGKSWRVRQRWIGVNGEKWTDVSAWFWSARRGGIAAWSLAEVIPN